MIVSIQIILSIGLISPAVGMTYQLLIGIWPLTLVLYVGVDLWILLMVSIMKKYVKNLEEVIEKNYMGILCMAMILFLMIVFWREMATGKGTFSYQALGGFPIFIMLIGIIILILFVDIVSRYQGVEKEKETLLVREEIGKKQYEELVELISQNRQIVHDIKNHLLIIKEYARCGENDSIQNYIDAISKEYAVSMSKYWTGNKVIDFILNQKILKAEKNNIEVTVKTGPIGNIPLGESEICALFGNLLDNAIEATQKITDEKRWIEVYLSQKKNMFFVEIDNNFVAEPKVEDGELISLKGNSHGYGIKSVKRIVDKYDGMFTYKAGNHVFRVNISFLSFEGPENTFKGNTLYEEEFSCENEYSLKGKKDGKFMKRKIVSTIFYILNLGLFFFPWIVIGEEKYNFFQFVWKNSTHGMAPFMEQAGIPLEQLNLLEGAVSLQVFLMLVNLVFSAIYLISALRGRKLPFNLAVIATGIVIAYLHNTFPGTLGTLAPAQITTAFSLFFILIPVIEFFTTMVMDRWNETVEESRDFAAEEKAWKEEVKRRLAFAGQYDRPFYHVVWKNFKANWKDYILLLVSCILIISFVVVGFGIQKLMSIEYSLSGIQVLNGLGAILINAIMPLAIVSFLLSEMPCKELWCVPDTWYEKKSTLLFRGT